MTGGEIRFPFRPIKRRIQQSLNVPLKFHGENHRSSLFPLDEGKSLQRLSLSSIISIDERFEPFKHFLVEGNAAFPSLDRSEFIIFIWDNVGREIIFFLRNRPFRSGERIGVIARLENDLRSRVEWGRSGNRGDRRESIRV